mmetsp:Transcript_23890/g.94741  ORF Transcript_23890/g.94741 Transcript_23890/m.94741 type:complete len:516 (+) Transcript_23890:246-1793(+)
MVLPRSVRKAFARLTGLHGFFSGKKPATPPAGQPRSGKPPGKGGAPAPAAMPKAAGKQPKPAAAPARTAARVEEQKRVAPAPEDEESKASPHDDDDAKPVVVVETPPAVSAPPPQQPRADDDDDDAATAKAAARVAAPPSRPSEGLEPKHAEKKAAVKKHHDLSRRPSKDGESSSSSALQASFLASAAKLGVDPSKLTPPPKGSGAKAAAQKRDRAPPKEAEEPKQQPAPVEKPKPETPPPPKKVAPAPATSSWWGASSPETAAAQDSKENDDDDDDEVPETTSKKAKAAAPPAKVDDTLARIDALLKPQPKPAPKPKAPPDVEALFAAVERRDADRVVALLEHTPVDSRDPRLDNYTALFIAAEDGDTAMVDLLMKRGADVEARDNKGRSPLFAAAVIGQAKVVDHLIVKWHANPDVRDRQGHHVFWAACAFQKLDAAAAVLDASARRGVWTVDLNAKDPKSKLNAYDWAVARGNTDVVAFLEKRGGAASRQGNVKQNAIQYELLELDKILNQP